MSKSNTEFLDELEGLVVEMVYNYLKEALPDATKEQARNLVGKMGTRIMFGADIFDKSLKVEEPKS